MNFLVNLLRLPGPFLKVKKKSTNITLLDRITNMWGFCLGLVFTPLLPSSSVWYSCTPGDLCFTSPNHHHLTFLSRKIIWNVQVMLYQNSNVHFLFNENSNRSTISIIFIYILLISYACKYLCYPVYIYL